MLTLYLILSTQFKYMENVIVLNVDISHPQRMDLEICQTCIEPLLR